MPADNLGERTYASFMAAGGPLISLHVDFKEPIELGAFVGLFASIGSQYDKYIRANHPDLAPEADIYVKEIRAGSIEADLLPWLWHVGLPGMLYTMDGVLVVDGFVRTYGARLANYFVKGGRDQTATKSDLKDFMDAVEAIANDPEGAAQLESAVFEDGKKEVRAALKFTNKEAKIAQEQLRQHRAEIEHRETGDHERVLMVFSQSNIKSSEIGKKSGEKVIISSISDKELSLIYASDLAEQRIKHEIIEADDNVYKKGFVVDVNVETLRGRPVAYRVTNLHEVIDLPED